MKRFKQILIYLAGVSFSLNLLSGYLHFFHSDHGRWTLKENERKNKIKYAKQVKRGKILFDRRLCADCHGGGGKKPVYEFYPKLYGQNVEYLVNQMKDIQSGIRNNGMSSAMAPALDDLNENDLRAIALYLSGEFK